MYTGRLIFSQVMDFLPKHTFNALVRRYQGNYRVRHLTCWDHYLCMAFAQLTYRESLRDIEACLRALGPKLYHAGLRGSVSKSTLADANEKRDYRIYADLAGVLIAHARELYAKEDFGLSLDHTVYAFDSTTIDLCLSLFPWAQFRKRKGAIKLHTLMDLRGSMPCFISITEGKTNDKLALDELPLEPGAFYIMDRGYIDFARLYVIAQHSAFFVIRSKNNLDYLRGAYRHVDKDTGLRSDQTIRLQGPKTAKRYPTPLRRVTFFDDKTRTRFVFLTNHFSLPALTIAMLYKCRWQVELFFKWIKQHLRIKAFYGTSPNAVKTQIWIAISVYVLVAIIKKRLNLELSLHEILQILSITLFEKVPIAQVVTKSYDKNLESTTSNQLNLFDF